MDNVLWFKLRSWHIVANYSPGFAYAKCGKRGLNIPISEDRPANEKTCETCLRLSGPR